MLRESGAAGHAFTANPGHDVDVIVDGASENSGRFFRLTVHAIPRRFDVPVRQVENLPAFCNEVIIDIGA